MKNIFVACSFLLVFNAAGMAFLIAFTSATGLLHIPMDASQVLLDVVCLPLFGFGCIGLVASGQAKTDLLYLLLHK